MLIRETTDDDGKQVAYFDQNGEWQKGEPSQVSVSGVSQIGGPETFNSEEAALASAQDDSGVNKSADDKPRKHPFVSKEDGEHLFGVPDKRKKALERIAKGSAYFGDKTKARDFITGNGLKDTHEAVETKPGRFEVREKGAAAAPAVAEKAIDRRNRLKAERALPEAKPNMGLPTNEQVEADKEANPQDWGPSLNETPAAPAKDDANTRARNWAERTAMPDERAATEADSLDAELQDALGKLGDVLGDVFGGKLNMMPAQYGAADLLPALSKVVELLVRKGFKSFAQATAKAAQVMRANAATAAHVDAISPRQWKAAYNAIADSHEGTDSEDVLSALTAADVKALVAEKAERAAPEQPAARPTFNMDDNAPAYIKPAQALVQKSLKGEIDSDAVVRGFHELGMSVGQARSVTK